MQAHDRARIAAITGASSGMGLVAAKALAAQGWRIIALGRDAQRSAVAEREIRAAAAPGVRIDMIRADLALLAQAARAADEVSALTDKIDVLLNNAGGTPSARVITAEGNEATFAGNHLGHFVFTLRLLPRLRAAAAESPAGATRVINMSSSAHEYSSGLNWENLQLIKNFVPAAAYCNAKLANLLFTFELAKRLTRSGIIVHAMHPGIVDTNFASHGDASMQAYFRLQTNVLTAEQGADTLTWLATAPEPGLSTGRYFYERKPIATSAAATDPVSAGRLWHESQLLARGFVPESPV